MQHSTLFIALCFQIALIMPFGVLAGCTVSISDDEAYLADEDSYATDEHPGLLPFHVVRFDHYPTAEEIEQELSDFMVKSPNLSLNPTNPAIPLPGQKRVTIVATTANIKDAGTDKAHLASVFARWRAGDRQDYSERFVLDAPNRDDLDRGSVNVFHYLLTLNSYVPGATLDRFIEANIINNSTDGWHCSRIDLTDVNSRGTARVQFLPFNEWVDTPSHPQSLFLSASNPDPLIYQGE